MWIMVGNNNPFCANSRRGQMKIMQMMFMIVGVVLFFVLVGLFFLRVSFSNLHSGARELAKEQAISSMKTIAEMPELSYDARNPMMLDEDKLTAMSGGLGENYTDFFPVASVEVYKIYPVFSKVIKCPAANCNYYDVYDSGQQEVTKLSSYVSICKKLKEFGSVYDKCALGKIVIGVKNEK